MNANLPALILLGIGVLAAVLGGIILLVAAFRQSVVWGLVALFVPMGNIVFTCVHWAEARLGFLMNFGGVLVCIGAVFTMPDVRAAMKNGSLPMPAFAKVEPAKQVSAKELSQQIMDKREAVEKLQGSFVIIGRELQTQYAALEDRRAGLKPADVVAVAKFNEEAAAYQARNTQHRSLQQQITQTQADLEKLIATRNGASQPGGGKKVVMYTTARCPACVMAKQYFAKKGVPYEEIDVERSAQGREAFQKLGGRGVPLIMVGTKRMEGFNSQAIDAALSAG